MARTTSGPLAWVQRLSRLDLDERGATATEYGVLAGFIAIVIVAGVGASETR